MRNFYRCPYSLYRGRKQLAYGTVTLLAGSSDEAADAAHAWLQAHHADFGDPAHRLELERPQVTPDVAEHLIHRISAQAEERDEPIEFERTQLALLVRLAFRRLLAADIGEIIDRLGEDNGAGYLAEPHLREGDDS